MKRIFVEKKSEQHKKEMSRRENPNLCKDLPVSDDGPPSKSHKMVKTFLDTCLLASLLNWRRKEPDQAKPTRSIVCALGWIYISLHHDTKQWNTSSKRLQRRQIRRWCILNKYELPWFCTMAIRVVEFSNGGYKIRKVFA